MLFLTPGKLLQYLTMSETPDYVMAAQAALETASLALAADLRCDFDQVIGQTDLFSPNENNPFTKLKLSYGFVSLSPAPVVTQYNTYESLAAYQGTTIMPYSNTDPLLTASALLTANCTFDYVKGITTVNNCYFGGQLITVVYNAGFGPDASDPTLYDQTLVPAWLISLANLRARIDLSAHPAFADTKAIYNPKSLEEQYGTIVSRRCRFAPDAILTV